MIYSLMADDIPLLSQWIKKSDKSKLVGFFGDPSGIRTPDTLIKSHTSITLKAA